MQLVEVTFNSQPIQIIENGKHWVSVNAISENIGLDAKGQRAKLKADPTYEAKLLKVQTAGGVQEVFCIPLDKLNGWLFSINPNKTKPEVREKLILYKKECFRVLYNHFTQKASQSYTQPLLPENYDSRINGYKGQLAKKRAQIEQMQDELAKCQEELAKCQAQHSNLDIWQSEIKVQQQKAEQYRNKMEHFRALAGYQLHKIGIIYNAVDELTTLRSEFTATPNLYLKISEVIEVLNTHIQEADTHVAMLQIPPLTKKLTH